MEFCKNLKDEHQVFSEKCRKDWDKLILNYKGQKFVNESGIR
jgi:hypothetical protein